MIILIEETLWDETTRQIEKYLGIDTEKHIEQYYNEFMWNLYGESDDDNWHKNKNNRINES